MNLSFSGNIMTIYLNFSSFNSASSTSPWPVDPYNFQNEGDKNIKLLLPITAGVEFTTLLQKFHFDRKSK